jgi:hypothetical protein
MLAMELRASNTCAREMRGMQSMPGMRKNYSILAKKPLKLGIIISLKLNKHLKIRITNESIF